MTASKSLNFPISGFPEYTPEVRDIERQWLAKLAGLFESYGYANIETPSVETVETLASKGEDVDKEIYALSRLAAAEGESKQRYALHYDLTVPTARYVAKHAQDLVFPFKRYQMQRCWRGERPQEGRFREFTQCDIDVIDNETVSLDYDAEMLEVAATALGLLKAGPVRFQISNRRIMNGLGEALGLADATLLARILDKVEKLTTEQLSKRLGEELGLSTPQIDTCLQFCQIKGGAAEIENGLSKLGLMNDQIAEGQRQLCDTLEQVDLAGNNSVRIEGDLSISRGFDYYTGVVYEAKLIDFPDYPTICAGGRYENLVGSFMRRKLPGVGISIGLTRIFTKLYKEGLLEPGRKSPTQILVVSDVPEASDMNATARALRALGWNVETLPGVKKMDKQLKYANNKGIPFVWATNRGETFLKDLDTGAQDPVDIATFSRKP